MSEIQNVSDVVVEQNDDVVTYESLNKSENTIAHLNYQFSEHNNISSSEYNSLLSSENNGIVSSEHQDLSSSDQHGVTSSEYYDISTSEFHETNLSQNALKDNSLCLFEDNKAIYYVKETKNDDTIAHLADTNQSFDILAVSICCNNNSEGASNKLKSESNKCFDFVSTSRPNDESKLSYLSTKKLATNICNALLEINDIDSLISDRDYCSQVGGANRLSDLIKENENQTRCNEIGQDDSITYAPDKYLTTVQLSEENNKTGKPRPLNNVSLNEDALLSEETGVFISIIDNISASNIENISASTARIVSSPEDLSTSQNDSDLYNQINDANRLSVLPLTLEDDSAGIYDEIISSHENYPEIISAEGAIDENDLQEQT